MAAETVHMDRIHPYRPRVSRETRLLLTTALIAIVALWVLARVRFPDRPPPQNPVQPLLTQLTPRPTFDDLASEIAVLRPRLEPLLVNGPAGCRVCAFETMSPPSGSIRGRQRRAECRLALRYDPASGLSLVQIEPRSAPTPELWSPEPVDRATSSPPRCRLQACRFDRSMWACSPPSTVRDGRGRNGSSRRTSDVAPGSFLFTADAAVAGLVVDHGDGHVLVPAATVLAEADRLLDRPPRRARTSASTCSRSPRR